MPRITISYRREDSGVITGRIFDRLVARYGRDTIFRDIDNIPIGVDFRKHIDQVVDASDIVLAVVGPYWVGPLETDNRLNSQADPVRVEIEAALRKDVPLVPTLVLGAVMPRADELPESLHDFAYRNAVRIDAGQDFDVHMARLIRAVDGILGMPGGAAAAEGGAPESVDRPKSGRRLHLAIAASIVVLLGIAAAGGYIGAYRYGPPQDTGSIAANRPPSLAPTAPQTPPPAPSVDAELLFWQSISGSNNAADFEEYLRRYPSGQFAGLARNRINSLTASPPAAEAPNVNALFVQFENNPVAASAAYGDYKSLFFEFDDLDVSNGHARATKHIRLGYDVECTFPANELDKLKAYSVGEQIPTRVKLTGYRVVGQSEIWHC